MKTHLRILLGPDRRYNLIKNTTLVCKDYFNTIGVLNAGPKFYYDEISQILPEYVNIRHHPDFFDIECARRDLLSDVPIDDWVMWLDGDETPSFIFLENMHNIIEECENNDYNVVLLPWYLHMNGKPEHDYNYFFENLASRNIEELKTTRKHYFSPKRFIKNVKNKWINSNWGAHEYFKFEFEKYTYYGYIVNHYKTMHDWEQSPVWHLFMNPLVHNLVTNDQIASMMDMEAFKKLEECKTKHNVYTSSDFIKEIINENLDFKKDFLSIFNSLDMVFTNLHDSTDNRNVNRMFQLVKNFINKYNFEFKLNPSYYCGQDCCKYKNIQL